ncbi:MAG: hypothetical protein ABFD92_18225 [Planctomycetaceae bacterium]|nr:hypothetical protein [Planctomycetaceae bacterium]
MQRLGPTIIVIWIAAGCSDGHTLLVSQNDPSAKEILAAVARVRPGMSVEQMLQEIVPVANSSPCFQRMSSNEVRYFFVLGANSQIQIMVRSPKNLPQIYPDYADGIIISVGKIEPLQKWPRRKYEDSNGEREDFKDMGLHLVSGAQ